MNIHVIEKVFSEDTRKRLVESSKPLIVKGSDIKAFYATPDAFVLPGRRSHPSVHLHPDFVEEAHHVVNIIKEKLGLDLVIVQSHINLTVGNKEESCWHRHNCDYTVVYYMKTMPFFNSGTLFKEQGFVRAPQNSILFCSADTEHMAPTTFFRNPFRVERYTWAIDLNKRDSLTK